MSYQAFVCACDAYAWIFPDFIRLAAANIPFPVNFYSEHIYDENYNILPTHNDIWYERMLYILNNLGCRDVIYLQEDFLTLGVDMEAIDESYHLHKNKQACITKLGNNYEFKTHKYPVTVGRYQVYLQSPNDEYLMSHQPVSIFNREFLIASLKTLKPAGPSEHELDGSKWMRNNGLTRVFCLGEANRPNKSEIFHIEHAIRKGEVLENVKQYLSNW